MTQQPLAIDLFGGLGGWAEGFLSEGYRVIGFDIERHDYGTGGYPAQLVLQDVTTLHGSQFRDAAVIVASPPCQAYSYRAMPWSRAKALPPPDNTLFEAPFRIQQEASEAAGRYIPLVVENVRGAQKWVGRAKANFGSYYLWGDVGMVGRRVVAGFPRFGVSVAPIKAIKVPGFLFDGSGGSFQTASVEATGYKSSGMNWSDRSLHGQDFTRVAGQQAQKRNPDGTEHGSGSWFKIADSKNRGTRSARGEACPDQPLLGTARIAEETEENSSAILEGASQWKPEPYGDRGIVQVTPVRQEGIKNPNGGTGGWFGSYEEQKQRGTISPGRMHGSKSAKRRAASAQIAKIPFPLASHIAKCFRGDRSLP